MCGIWVTVGVTHLLDSDYSAGRKVSECRSDLIRILAVDDGQSLTRPAVVKGFCIFFLPDGVFSSLAAHTRALAQKSPVAGTISSS